MAAGLVAGSAFLLFSTVLWTVRLVRIVTLRHAGTQTGRKVVAGRNFRLWKAKWHRERLPRISKATQTDPSVAEDFDSLVADRGSPSTQRDLSQQSLEIEEERWWARPSARSSSFLTSPSTGTGIGSASALSIDQVRLDASRAVLERGVTAATATDMLQTHVAMPVSPAADSVKGGIDAVPRKKTVQFSD